MYLITYMTDYNRKQCYAYAIHEDPIQFILSCQDYPETYYLINAQLIPEEHYQNRYIEHRSLKGL